MTNLEPNSKCALASFTGTTFGLCKKRKFRMRLAKASRYAASFATRVQLPRAAGIIHRALSPVTPCGQADERAEREWSSGADGEHLAGAGAATSLLVSSSSDGDMLLQVGC